MKKIFFLLIALIFCISIEAQSKQWTLQECMQFAIENSLRINKQKTQNNITQQDYLYAIGRLLPSINANSSADFSFGRAVSSETNTYVDINSFSNSYSLYSNLTIFDGLSNIYRVKMQKINKLQGKQLLEQEKEMVAYETMEAFFNVCYYKKTVQLAQEQLLESSNVLKQAKRMEELGLKSKTDIAEMAAKEASDSYNLTKQNNLFNIGIIILKEKMNFPIDEALDIFQNDEDELIVKSLESTAAIFDKAKTTNPKTVSASLTLKAQKTNRNVAFGSLLPSIGLEAGFSTGFVKYMDGSEYTSFIDQLKEKRGTYIGFSLSIPIFNSFYALTNYNRSKMQYLISQNEYEEQLRSLYSEVEQAVADMNGQADAYLQAVKQLEAMETAHQANQRKYNEGLISAFELHTSSNRVIEAKTEVIKAELQYHLKARLVSYYKGESFVN